MWWRIYLDVFNWHAWYFLWHFFAFHDSFSTRNGSPSFVRACFYIKLLHIFLKILVFRCISTSTEQELFRLITASSSIYSEKCKYEFSNITFCFWFFLSTRVLQGMWKNQKTNQFNQKKVNAEIQVTLKHAPVRKLTEEKML